ncbi:Leucine-rich repeat protein kinase family protein [Rhynchospora pubera]|uniref:Leucine-rich repeat protein kinase family protein n=1 Tax=Rhynchospora pubera TaxID=906938 RepID=A0AAV8GNJ2_9POAL|nr:Leucine-rich repeat protein kinase family protein [Rhynchospora pubera]
MGADDFVRYPDDPYDRIWTDYTGEWPSISTNSTVKPDTDFATPSLVMQTASTTNSTKQPLIFPWTSNNKSSLFLIILHIGEIQDIPRTDYREFNIYADGYDVPLFDHIVPQKLTSVWASYWDTDGTTYNVSFKATSNSTLPPLLNAIELYYIRPATGILTYSGDGKFDHSYLTLNA